MVTGQPLEAKLERRNRGVQKYERGANRVSASKLYEIAKTLQVPVSFFFDGLADPMDGSDGDEIGQQAERIVQEFLTTPEGLELAEVFPKIGRGRVRRQVLDLVRAMAEEATRAENAAA
jgi:transcriptional regulator with XRE-family HTH domain